MWSLDGLRRRGGDDDRLLRGEPDATGWRSTRRTRPVKVEELLWRLVDKYAPAPPAYSMLVRPTWFDHAGDLVVVDGPIAWETPWLTEGGFSHQLPAGTHPVYAGTCAFPPQDED